MLYSYCTNRWIIAVFDCTCNTQNSLLLNQHSGDDAPQDKNWVLREFLIDKSHTYKQPTGKTNDRFTENKYRVRRPYITRFSVQALS